MPFSFFFAHLKDIQTGKKEMKKKYWEVNAREF